MKFLEKLEAKMETLRKSDDSDMRSLYEDYLRFRASAEKNRSPLVNQNYANQTPEFREQHPSLKKFTAAISASDPFLAALASRDLAEELKRIKTITPEAIQEKNRLLAASRKYLRPDGLLTGLIFANYGDLSILRGLDENPDPAFVGGLNMVLASEEVVRFVCGAHDAQTGRAQKTCTQMIQNATRLKSLYDIIDKLTWKGDPTEYAQAMSGLLPVTQLYRELTRSLLREASRFGAGAAITLVTPEVTEIRGGLGIGIALIHHQAAYDLIQKSVTENGQVISGKPSQVRLKLLSQITAEVTSEIFDKLTTENLYEALSSGVGHAAKYAAITATLKNPPVHDILGE